MAAVPFAEAVKLRLRVDDLDPLRTFLAGAGRAQETFRYFATRPLDVVRRHVCTWLLYDDGLPIAYGHLDREDGIVWLGIAVHEQRQGRGHGRAMMRLLLAAARAHGVTHLRLSVDHANTRAIGLYESSGFVRVGATDRVAFFECDVRPSCRVVVSSMAFEGLPLARMIDEASRAELALEFSSGMPFDPAAEETFRTAKISRLAHNYFPAPEVPFVLNLASADPRIRQRSIEHCVRGLHLSAVVGAPFFSVHAGFSIEVLPEHLGTRLSSELAPARLDAWPLFISAIREILARTVDLPVGLLVENHVVSRENRAPNGTHALLCADACECLRLVEDVGDTRLGLLSDTGHWTVTAATLGFDRCEAVLATLPHTRCFHHSDNDARVDDNGPLDEDYWFLPFMVQARHAVHVLEVRACPAAELARMNDVLFRRHSS